MKRLSPGLPLEQEKRARRVDSFGEARLGETARALRGVGKAQREDAPRLFELAREGDISTLRALEGPRERSMLIEILPAIGSAHEPGALVGEWAVGKTGERASAGAALRDKSMLGDPSGIVLPGPAQVRGEKDDELVGALHLEANEND